MQWIWLAIAAVPAALLAMTMVIAYVIFFIVLVRNKPEKWSRNCSLPDDEELVRIYEDASRWANENAFCRKDVGIVNDGFRLFGEYYDFGFDRAVIIIPGRMEACRYSCHFAQPYKQAGYNVLTIDNRSHGLSEGKYNSLGFKEYRDIIAWGKFLHREHHNAEVVLHGICIGSSTALFAMTSPDCPEYICAMTADGMYQTFYETFKNHMISQGRPLYPFLWEVMLYIRIFAGANVVTDGPIRRMRNMKKPILFLHSRADIFSVPEKAQELYDLCPAPKHIEWFDTGDHSRIRINHPEHYDDTIVKFFEKSL